MQVLVKEQQRDIKKLRAQLSGHRGTDLGARISRLETTKQEPEHVAAQIACFFDRSHTPLVSHLTDLLEMAQERLDALEDAAQTTTGDVVSIVRGECTRLLAENQGMSTATHRTSSASSPRAVCEYNALTPPPRFMHHACSVTNKNHAWAVQLPLCSCSPWR